MAEPPPSDAVAAYPHAQDIPAAPVPPASSFAQGSSSAPPASIGRPAQEVPASSSGWLVTASAPQTCPPPVASCPPAGPFSGAKVTVFTAGFDTLGKCQDWETFRAWVVG